MHLHMQHRPPRIPRVVVPFPTRARRLARLVEAFDRDEIEASVDLLIAALDARDGDADAEETGLEDGFATSPWAPIGAGCPVADPGGSGQPGLRTEDDEDDDEDEEHDGRENIREDDELAWPETDGRQAVYAFRTDASEDDEPSNVVLLRQHRNRIRATRCDHWPRGWPQWTLRKDRASGVTFGTPVECSA